MKYLHGFVIVFYLILISIFLIAEIGAQLKEPILPFLINFRATNQILILFGLFFLPFLIPALNYLIQKLKVKVAGVEVDAEFREIKGKIETIQTEQSDLSGRIDNTQAVFQSIIRGKDPSSKARIDNHELKIGCKDYNEQKLLSQILAQHIKHYFKDNFTPPIEIKCELIIPNGGTMKNYYDLINGWIDGYIEYTGTGCMLLGEIKIDAETELIEIPDKINERSKKLDHKVVWLDPIGFTNNYVIVVNKENLKRVYKISDLVRKAKNLTFAGNMEFMNRPVDGFPSLCSTYRLDFKKAIVCGYSDRYRLLKEKKVDVINGFQTDPELDDDRFIVLEDPERFFPEYYAIPVFREDVFRIPSLKDSINAFGDYKLNKKKMRSLISKFSACPGRDMKVKLAGKDFTIKTGF
jgi:glycine betaine/choline ABC-type transport system substrate-binding protein/uncharacterized membrane protein YciS (DUF1049 family)